MTYSPTNIVQYNEYYPFGLQTERSWTRDNSKNNFLYNGGTEINTNSGWYACLPKPWRRQETFYRGYDPALGRFLQVDPLASSAHNMTPYCYGNNNPALMNDPLGNRPKTYVESYYGPYIQSGGVDLSFAYSFWATDAENSMGGTVNGNGTSSPGGVFVLIDDGGRILGFSFTGEEAGSFITALQNNSDMLNSILNSTDGLDFNKNGQLGYWSESSTVDNSTNHWSGVDSQNSLSTLNQVATFTPLKASQGWQSQPDLGFINIDRFSTIEGSRPDYRGVFIHATYYPSETEKYSSYNWIFLEQTNHASIIRTDPNNLVNQGPHFFGEEGSLSIFDNSMHDASVYPTENFTGTMTLYGIQGNTSTQIGTITYGYNYSNGILTPVEPVIDYVGR